MQPQLIISTSNLLIKDTRLVHLNLELCFVVCFDFDFLLVIDVALDDAELG